MRGIRPEASRWSHSFQGQMRTHYSRTVAWGYMLTIITAPTGPLSAAYGPEHLEIHSTDTVVTFARSEDLPAHGDAITARFER